MGIVTRAWPNIYKVVLVLTVLLAASAIAFHVFVLSPLAEEHEECLYELEKERGKVASSEWDASESGLANGNKLYSLAIGTKRDPGTRAWSDALLERSTKRLQAEVDAVKRASRNTFIGHDGKKTYSDKYDEVKKRFKEAGKKDRNLEVELLPDVFGMERISEGNYYNMTLKLLLTEDVVGLLHRHHLSIMKTPRLYAQEQEQIFLDVRDRKAQKKIPASELKVLPVRSYAIRKGEAPYLLEVSLKVKVTGAIADFAAFVAELQGADYQYALTNLEVQTERPVMRPARYGQSQLIGSQENARAVRIESIVASFTCSGFAYPETDLSKPKPRRKPLHRSSRGSSSAASEKPLGI